MKLEDQVCSLGLAQKLKTLGVKQESAFFWTEATEMLVSQKRRDELIQEGEYPYSHYGCFISAFTVAELGQMLPRNENIVTMLFANGHAQIAIQEDKQVAAEHITDMPHCWCSPEKRVLPNGAIHIVHNHSSAKWGAAGQCIEADTEADARARMLIYLIENKLITV